MLKNKKVCFSDKVKWEPVRMSLEKVLDGHRAMSFLFCGSDCKCKPVSLYEVNILISFYYDKSPPPEQNKCLSTFPWSRPDWRLKELPQ